MPPEPLPWDNHRRGGDFRRQQQHDRSGSDPRGFGLGSSSHHRWRENYHHHNDYYGHHAPLPHAPPPSSYHHQQQRWYSDFRNSRPPPHAYPGHGKQGGWHMYPDDAADGFMPFASRYGDRNLDDDNSRPFGSRGGDERYFRNNRDNRGSFTHKEWRTASPNGPGRSNTDTSTPRSTENTRTWHDNSNKSSVAPRPQADAANQSGHSQSVATEKPNKNGTVAVHGQDSSALKLEKKDSLGSIDWKPLKWSRSGSLTSRGPSLRHPSCSKSVVVESADVVADTVQVKNNATTTVRSPAPDAAACATSTASAPSDDDGSRKKPRLGWGEGLAKYEKKKVEGPEDGGAVNNELFVSVGDLETLQSPCVSIPDRTQSPRDVNLLDCASPTTPSSVACSSSPGVMNKESDNKANADEDMANFSCSPGIDSHISFDGPVFNLENLELSSIANLSSLIDELLRSDSQCTAGTHYVGSSAMNKLMVWKADVLKGIELTESEIESLETELKSLGTETIRDFRYAADSRSQPADCPLQACKESGSASHVVPKPDSLWIGDTITENNAAQENDFVGSKADDFDSPSSATSTFVEALPAREDIFLCDTAKRFEEHVRDDQKDSILSEKGLKNDLDCEQVTTVDNSPLHVTSTCEEKIVTSDSLLFDVKEIYNAIVSTNKESAGSAWEELNKLLPSRQYLFDVSTAFNLSGFPRESSVVKDYFLTRKRFLQFKEKVLAIKFKVFQHFWRQGQVVSVKKLRAKAHKKYELSFSGLKKNRSSGRFRILSPAERSQTVPAYEVFEYVKKLLLHSPVKPCRSILKMPPLVLDNETKLSRFISTNGLVEDPCAVEKERSMINPWTTVEKEIFMNKLAIFGKDFRMIASFLNHKTTADCIEFYYKNHKSERSGKARKKPESTTQRKSQSSTYLIASGKKWNRESNTASLDTLGEASAIVATGNDDDSQVPKKYVSKFISPPSNSYKTLRNDGLSKRSCSPDLFSMYERETVAADVLAGICGSFSSGARSSRNMSHVDPANGSLDWRSQRVRVSVRRSLSPEVDDDNNECSDDSCGDIDSSDWTDDEKSLFIHALSTYGKDFMIISQCIRTRSKDQCKLFFSKARKCLNLDLIQPGARNCADVSESGGGSGDACAMETGSIISNSGSESPTDKDLPKDLSHYEKKLNHESNTGGTRNSKPDSKMYEEKIEPGPCSSMADKPVLEIEIKGVNMVSDKVFSDCNVGSREQKLETMVVSAGAVSEPGVDKECDSCLPSRLREASTDGIPKETSDDKIVEVRKSNSVDAVNGSSFGVSEVIFGPNLSGDGSHSSTEAHSSLQDNKRSDLQIEKSQRRSHGPSSQQSDHLESMKSLTLFSVPIKYQKFLKHDALSLAHGNKDPEKDVRESDCQQQLASFSLPVDSVDSSQILKGYPVSVQTVKDINGDITCKPRAPIEKVPKRDGRFDKDHLSDFFLQKCNGSKQQSKIVKAPFITPELSSKDSSCRPPHVDNKPSSNGDVRLFGKILVSSQQPKPSSRELEATDIRSCTQRPKTENRQSLNLNHLVNSDSAKTKIDLGTSFLGSENIPYQTSGFWQGENHIQMGCPPMPDSTFLLAKYPSAFGNYPVQPQFSRTTAINNGLSVLSNKEIISSNVIEKNYSPLMNGNGELQHHHHHHPLVVDMQHQMKNGFDLVSGMREQARGMVGINVAVSDPVAAIRMHYAKHSENKEDDNYAWRINGDLGR